MSNMSTTILERKDWRNFTSLTRDTQLLRTLVAAVAMALWWVLPKVQVQQLTNK